jgi:hypothetical protein
MASIYMRVHLRRGYICMTEHLLERAQVGTAFEKVRCERVPERVRVQRLEPHASSVGANNPEYSPSRESATTRVQEDS